MRPRRTVPYLKVLGEAQTERIVLRRRTRAVSLGAAILMWALAFAVGAAVGYLGRGVIENPPCLQKAHPHWTEIYPCGWMEG